MKRHHVVVGMIAKIPRSQCVPLKKVPPSLDQRIGGDGSVLDLASSVPLTTGQFFCAPGEEAIELGQAKGLWIIVELACKHGHLGLLKDAAESLASLDVMWHASWSVWTLRW